MKINDVIEVQVTSEPAVEPVSLEQVKRHLNLLFDTTGSYEFDDDDNYLTELITQCRDSLEQWLGISMSIKTLRAILKNECGGIEIPFGPVVSITSVKDVDGVVLVDGTSYKLRGNQFKWVESPISCYVDITYTAGYATDDMPKGLVRALLEEIAFRYNNRGDGTNKFAGENIGVSKGAMELASKYTRKSLVS